MERTSPAATLPIRSITDAEPPEEVNAAVTSMMRENSIPGLSLAVVNRESTLWAACSGQADYSSNQPAVPSTAYLWFSMTIS